MPTAQPTIENRVNGQIQKWTIEANDPELDEVFPEGYRDGEIGISSYSRSLEGFEDASEVAKALEGSWNVKLDGIGSERVIGETEITAEGNIIKLSAHMGEKLDEHIGKYFSEDEREQKAGDSTFDSDHANEILGSDKIIFFRDIESQDDGSEQDQEQGDKSSSDQNDGIDDTVSADPTGNRRKILIAGAIILGYMVVSR